MKTLANLTVDFDEARQIARALQRVPWFRRWPGRPSCSRRSLNSACRNAHFYSAGVGQGGSLVIVNAPEDQAEEVETILEDNL